MILSLSLALASLAAATPATLNRRQGSAPCAELSSAYDGFVSAELALACLRSVPLRATAVLQSQLAGLRSFTEFQSDIAYLNSSNIAARLYPAVDLLGGISTLEQRINDSFYDNEYDFQLDIARLFASAYDGHLVYIPDIVGVFGFQRTQSGIPFNLISISSDGNELPEIYAARDAAALSNAGTFLPSPVSEINGGSVLDFLNEQAALTGPFHDPDANYNRLFARPVSDGFYANGNFANIGILFGGAEDTVLRFSNGSDQTLQTIARSNMTGLSLEGLTDGESLFERCCSGTSALRDILESVTSSTSMSLEAKDRVKSYVGPQVSFHDPRQRHMKRQTEDRVIDPGFPQPTVNTSDGSLIGYLSESESDLAILVLPSFAIGLSDTGSLAIDYAVVEEYIEALTFFLDEASSDGRSRLIIDVRGNGGGLGYMPHEVFRQLFPSAGLPNDAANFRAHDLYNFVGSTVTSIYTDNPLALFLEELRPSFGTFGFDSTQQLTEDNSTFSSWSDFYGPVQVPSVEGDFTNLARANLSDPLQTSPVDLSRSNPRDSQVFSAENIVIVQDGACASACALLVEFLKTNAPGGPVRQIALGGRPQTGPMQGVGGVKGGQLGAFEGIALLTAGGATLTAQSAQTFNSQFGSDVVETALQALDRGVPGAGAVNYRNSIREEDDSLTPLQYLYEAADCRLWYTRDVLVSQQALWQSIAAVAFEGEDGACVEGSTGHPSANAGPDIADVEVPGNAASRFGVTISSESNAGGGPGTVNQNNGGGEDEEGSAATANVSVLALMAAVGVAIMML